MNLEKGESSSNMAETEMSSTGTNGVDHSAKSKGKGVDPDLEACITIDDGTHRLDMTKISSEVTIGRDSKKFVTSSCPHRKPSNVKESQLSKKAYHSEINVVAIGLDHGRNCDKLYFTDEYKSDIVKWMKEVFTLNEEKFLTEIRNNPEKYKYSGSLNELEKYSKMLLLDSCFIFFTLKRLGNNTTTEMHKAIGKLGLKGNLEQLREKTDSLAAKIFMHREEIMLDFIIFGNQIPLIAVEELIETYQLHNFIDGKPIRDLALLLFKKIFPIQNTELNMEKSPKFINLLHIFHWSRIPTVKKYEIVKIENCRTPYIPSATEIRESGITFKKKSSGSFLEITFEEGLFKIHGTFRIPVVHVDKYNEIIFRSLLAFEQENTDHGGSYFTAYTSCMAHLLQSESDVKLLKEKRILTNTPITDIEVVEFFQNLKSDTEISKDIPQLHHMYNVVRVHNESKISRNYGQFKLRYCSNLWVTLGVILFVIATTLQTVFTVLSYLKPPGNH